MNESLSIATGRPVLRIERQLRHSQDDVWNAITDQEQLSTWYPFSVISMDFRVGGKIQFDDGAGTTFPATIVEIEPPRIFSFSESPPEQMLRESADLIHMELSPLADGCLLVFSHTFSDLPAAASYTTGWTGCLDALEARLDGHEDAPELDWVATHESWVKAFGLDQGSVETANGTAIVRFERLLMRQPIEKTWSVIADGTDLTTGSDVPQLLAARGVETGPLLVVRDGKSIEYQDASGGQITWVFSGGPGGARLELTHAGGESTGRLERWRDCVENLVQTVIGTP